MQLVDYSVQMSGGAYATKCPRVLSIRTQAAPKYIVSLQCSELNKREVTHNEDPRGMAIFWQLLPVRSSGQFSRQCHAFWGVTLEKLRELHPGDLGVHFRSGSGPFSAIRLMAQACRPMSGFSSLHGYSGDPGMNMAGCFLTHCLAIWSPVASWQLASS